MEFVDELLALATPAERRTFLLHHLHFFTGNDPEELSLQLKNKANSLLSTEQRQRALDITESLLYVSSILSPIFGRERDLARARGLMVLANYRRRDGEFARAALYYDEAHRLCLSHNSPQEAIRCQMALANTLSQLNRADEALEMGQQAINLAQQTGNNQLLADVYSNVATVLTNKGEYLQAIELFNLQHEILMTLGETGLSGLLHCYHGLAENNLYLNRFEEVIVYATRARDLAIKLDQKIHIAYAAQLLGNALFYQGHYTRALRCWDGTLDLFKNQKVFHSLHWVNQWRLLCLIQLNRLDEALDLSEELVVEADHNNWKNFHATVTYFRGILKSRLGLDKQALADYAQAVAIFADMNEANWVARIQLDQAGSLVVNGLNEEAEILLYKAEQEFLRQQTPRWLAQLKLERARLCQRNVDNTGALDNVRQAQEVVGNLDLPALNYQALNLLGEIAEQENRVSDAFEFYRQATEQIERLRGAVVVELRGDFLKDKMVVYEAAVQTALDLADVDRAYDYLERSKSRALTELLVNQLDLQLKPRHPSDVSLVEKLKILREEHTHYFNLVNQPLQIVTNLRGMKTAPVNTGTDHAQAELRRVEKQIEQLLMQLQVRNADYAEDYSLLEITSESPQPWLDEDTLLVEYYIAREEVLALAISATEKRVFRHLLDSSKLSRMVDSLSLNLQNLKPHLAAKFLPATRAHLGNLYRSLFAPLAGFAAKFQKLIFVAHGPLHYLPFHALWIAETDRYLLEDFEISYLPSASQLKFYRQRAEKLATETVTRSLVMGYSANDSLTFVAQEATEVAVLFGEKPLLENEVVREKLSNDGKPYRVIHLASHGQFRPDAPLFSFVEMADGRLMTTDLFDIRLNASLVTLSACESGLNVITGGDELVGLSRACLYAGAASLLLSLWRVEDHSTTLLMKEFYRLACQPNVSKAAALRRAQISLLQGELASDSAYQHPFFWAPFFLIGENGCLS